MNQKSKLKKLNRILKKVRSFEPQMKKQSDEELSGLTLKFKERLAKASGIFGGDEYRRRKNTGRNNAIVFKCPDWKKHDSCNDE